MRCLLFCLALAALSGRAHAAESVKVDLSADLGPATHRASGFLHAMSALEPRPEYVDPLRPKLFRMAAEDWHQKGAGAWANYDRVRRLGARMQVVISDNHGYTYSPWWPGDNDDWRAWEYLIETMVKRAQAGKRVVEWDIWNEPNHGHFWQRDRDRFFETWRRGFLKLRELDPKAAIVGPSISGYDRKYLEDFLTYCKTHDVVPDILAWHEFGSPSSIPKHVDEMRAFMKGLEISERPICLNEIINGDQSTKPGVTVKYFAAIERAKVDGACHACWDDKEKGVSACGNESLDGILTHPDRKPRSTWWAYKAYADVTGRLAGVKAGATVDGVAGTDEKARRVRVVLGRDKGEAGDVEVLFSGLSSLPWLSKQREVRIVAERIPNSGFDELSAPTKTVDAVRGVTGGVVQVSLPEFGPSDAYAITLEPVEKRKEASLEYSFDIWDWTAPARDLTLFERWAADLKSAGFTRLELSTPWNLLEPEPGKIDLSFIRDRLAICKKHGLGMRLRINSYYAGCTPGWYKGDRWQDPNGQQVFGIPSIADERFWEHYEPLCTAIAREFRGEDMLYNAFIGVHAELKYSDWWTYDPSSLKLWSQAIKRPRPHWLARVVGDAPLPERPPVPAATNGTPDSDPANLAFIAFREQMWRTAVERFTRAIRAGDPDARISSPLGESYRTLSAAFSNLDYWGMTRGSDQVVHSYDFFWHPGSTPMWHVRAVIETFQGITGLPVAFEFDGLPNIVQFGYTDDICRQMVRAIIDSGAGIKIANMSYAQELPSTHPVVRFAGERIAEAGAPKVTATAPEQTVLLFFSKWANYRYREKTEWLHDAQFGVWKLLRDMGVPTRVICEDNLSEDLSRYRGLVLAFSPLDVMPAEDAKTIERLGLPTVADVWNAPQTPPSGPGKPEASSVQLSGNRAVIGSAIGYHYLHGADPVACKQVMEQALEKAGVRR